MSPVKKVIATVVALGLIVAVFFGATYKNKLQTKENTFRETIKTGTYSATKAYAGNYMGVGTITNLSDEEIGTLAANVSDAVAAEVALGEYTSADVAKLCSVVEASINKEIENLGLILSPEAKTYLTDGIQAIVLSTLGNALEENGKISDETVDSLSSVIDERLKTLSTILSSQSSSVYTNISAIEQLLATLNQESEDKVNMLNKLKAEIEKLYAQLNEIEVQKAVSDSEKDNILSSIESLEQKITQIESGDSAYLVNLANDISNLKLSIKKTGAITNEDLEALKNSLTLADNNIKSIVDAQESKIAELSSQINKNSADLKASMADFQKSQAAVQSLVESMQNNKNGVDEELLNSRLSEVCNALSESLSNEISNVNTDINDQLNTITSDMSALASAESLNDAINTLQATMTASMSYKADRTDVDTMNFKLGDLQSDVDTKASQEDMNDVIADVNTRAKQSDFDDLKNNVLVNEDQIENNKDRIEAIEQDTTILRGEFTYEDGIPTLRIYTVGSP